MLFSWQENVNIVTFGKLEALTLKTLTGTAIIFSLRITLSSLNHFCVLVNFLYIYPLK